MQHYKNTPPRIILRNLQSLSFPSAKGISSLYGSVENAFSSNKNGIGFRIMLDNGDERTRGCAYSITCIADELGDKIAESFVSYND